MPTFCPNVVQTYAHIDIDLEQAKPQIMKRTIRGFERKVVGRFFLWEKKNRKANEE